MEYRKQTPEEGQERIGHTKWMVNHSKKEDLDKLMGMVAGENGFRAGSASSQTGGEKYVGGGDVRAGRV